MAAKEQKISRRKKGFEQTSSLLQKRIRSASESRGFSQSRLLTHWEEVVGEQTAAMALPVKVSYAQGGMGATLTLLTTGSFAPMVQAELPKIRERVNTVYGYNAIARIHVTQTAPTGFANGRVAFEIPKPAHKRKPDQAAVKAARTLSDGVESETLKAALEQLGANVLSKQANSKKVN